MSTSSSRTNGNDDSKNVKIFAGGGGESVCGWFALARTETTGSMNLQVVGLLGRGGWALLLKVRKKKLMAGGVGGGDGRNASGPGSARPEVRRTGQQDPFLRVAGGLKNHVESGELGRISR